MGIHSTISCSLSLEMMRFNIKNNTIMNYSVTVDLDLKMVAFDTVITKHCIQGTRKFRLYFPDSWTPIHCPFANLFLRKHHQTCIQNCESRGLLPVDLCKFFPLTNAPFKSNHRFMSQDEFKNFQNALKRLN